jgi:hypothetical protein
MAGNIIKLEGTIKQLTKSESGNYSFLLEDDNDNIHYCFALRKKPIGVPSDRVELIGIKTKSDKVRIEYLKNISKNESFDISEKSFNWMYSVALIMTIIMSGLTIYAVFTFTSFFSALSDPYNYSGISNFIFSILFLVIGPIGAIISGALTYFFSRSKRSDDQVAKYISDIESKPVKPITESKEEKTEFEAKKYCSSCGSSVPQGAKFCPICGSKI